MIRWGLAALLLAAPCGAQGVPFDTLKTRPAVSVQLRRVAADSLGAWCVVRGRHDAAGRSVYVDSIVEVPEAVNPDCNGRPVLLKRPPCLFAPSEFLWLRIRASYVILVCGEGHAFGIALASSGGSKVD